MEDYNEATNLGVSPSRETLFLPSRIKVNMDPVAERSRSQENMNLQSSKCNNNTSQEPYEEVQYCMDGPHKSPDRDEKKFWTYIRSLRLLYEQNNVAIQMFLSINSTKIVMTSARTSPRTSKLFEIQVEGVRKQSKTLSAKWAWFECESPTTHCLTMCKVCKCMN